MNKILLIDGNSILFRAYYGSAFSRDGILTTSFGTPVNAVLTFNNMINKYLTKYMPTHVYVAFDAGKKTFRHDKLPSYKAGRSAAPDEMKPQWPIVMEMLDLMKITHHQIETFEADDIIGTLATTWGKENEVFILSSDKDLYQLVNDNVTVIAPQNGNKEDKIVNAQNFVELNSITPDQVIDYKGMVGDASDNLPGVRGVGDKGAIKLLALYGKLENIYEHLDEMTPKLKEKFLEHKEMAFLCKELATIKIDIELDDSLIDIVYSNEVTEELIDFYRKYELNSLVRRFQNKVEKSETEFSNLDL